MQQRLFKFFVIAILPWVILLAVVANLWFLDSNQTSHSSTLFTHSSPVSYGIQAIVCLVATLVVLVSQGLAKVTVRPFESLLNQVILITTGRTVTPPEKTGMAEVDLTINNLYLAATNAQRRLDAERTLAADVSHQLRSPLAALSLRLEQISQDTRDSNVHDDSVAALGQVDRLVKLVEGLLTTWRSTTDRDLTEIKVPDLLANVSDRWQARAESSGRKTSNWFVATATCSGYTVEAPSSDSSVNKVEGTAVVVEVVVAEAVEPVQVGGALVAGTASSAISVSARSSR
jgi:signal transduction histidine kinase